MKPIILLIIILSSVNLKGQVEYFEYSNSDVIEIDQHVLNLLTGTKWYGNLTMDFIRGDTIISNIGPNIYYKKDWTYNSFGCGTWNIVKDKFITHAKDVDTSIEFKVGLIGVYGIIDITDSTLHLAKIQTSSHDMQRHLFFEDADYNRKVVQIDRTYEHPYIKTIYQHWSHNEGRYSNYHKTVSLHIDTISNMTMEELFFHNFHMINDSIQISISDTLIRIKWNNCN